MPFGEQLAKTAAHGIAGGVSSAVQGGKFIHGFLSAGTTQSFSGRIGSSFKTAQGRITAAAVLGGASSALGGGKFANGALTGAFSRAFNDEMEKDDGVADAVGEKAAKELIKKYAPKKIRAALSVLSKADKFGGKALLHGQAAVDGLKAVLNSGLNDINFYRQTGFSPTRRMTYTNRIVNWGKVDWVSYDQGGTEIDVLQNFFKASGILDNKE